jgi:hypothetical protein
MADLFDIDSHFIIRCDGTREERTGVGSIEFQGSVPEGRFAALGICEVDVLRVRMRRLTDENPQDGAPQHESISEVRKAKSIGPLQFIRGKQAFASDHQRSRLIQLGDPNMDLARAGLFRCVTHIYSMAHCRDLDRLCGWRRINHMECGGSTDRGRLAQKNNQK